MKWKNIIAPSIGSTK